MDSPNSMMMSAVYDQPMDWQSLCAWDGLAKPHCGGKALTFIAKGSQTIGWDAKKNVESII